MDRAQQEYHWGITSSDRTKVSLKLSKKGKTLYLDIPKTENDINTFEDAMALILGANNNLQRMSGCYCKVHKKYHRYFFGPHIEIGAPIGEWYGRDSKDEVIKLAKQLIGEYQGG